MKGRIGALDGVRGFALLAVLAYHSFPKVFRGGFVGVEVFFVLSGFLLTSLMLEERDKTERIDFLGYYGRRVRRIFPGMLALLAVLVVFVPIVAHDDAFRLRGDVLSSIGGITNWHLIADGSSYFDATGRPSFVRHLWSVAIELQFYVVCPFIVAWAARRRRKIAIAGLGTVVAASALTMAVRYGTPDPSRAYFGTDSRLSALVCGVLVAVVMHGREAPEKHSIAMRFAGAASLVVLVALVFGAHERARLMYPLGFLAVQAATGSIIALASFGIWPQRIFGLNFFRWFGKRSYGIYLWHWPIAVIVRPGIDVPWPHFVSALVILTGGCVLGALSYRWVERPFMTAHWARWDVRTTRYAMTGGAAAAAVVVVAATLVRPVPATNPIEQSLVAGERALAEQNQAPVSTQAPKAAPRGDAPVIASRKGTVLAQPAAVPRPINVPRGPAPGSVTVTAVGDSVMLGAVPSLKARLGSKSYIDAAKSRQFRAGTEVVHKLHAEGRLGRVVVIHLGNNGPVKPSELDAMMRELKAVAFVKFLTVRVDRGWQDSVNATFREAAKKYKHLSLIDWYAYSNGHRDWFQSDGTHLRRAGADAYAKLIGGSLPPPPTPSPKPPTPKPKPTPTPLLPVIETPKPPA